MSCNKFREFGLLYFYKELGTKETQKFEKHLEKCEVCQNRLKEIRDAIDLYEKIPEEEPSPVILRKILESSTESLPLNAPARMVFPQQNRRFNLWLPVIKVFQNFSRPVPSLVGASIGVIILVIAGYFFSQRPKSHLEWDNGINKRIELIEEEIYEFHQEAGILGGGDEILLGVENEINEIREKIKNLEKELQSEGVFKF